MQKRKCERSPSDPALAPAWRPEERLFLRWSRRGHRRNSRSSGRRSCSRTAGQQSRLRPVRERRIARPQKEERKVECQVFAETRRRIALLQGERLRPEATEARCPREQDEQ